MGETGECFEHHATQLTEKSSSRLLKKPVTHLRFTIVLKSLTRLIRTLNSQLLSQCVVCLQATKVCDAHVECVCVIPCFSQTLAPLLSDSPAVFALNRCFYHMIPLLYMLSVGFHYQIPLLTLSLSLHVSPSPLRFQGFFF